MVVHRGWAGPGFGVLAFGESLAVAGAVIPATPILFLVGTMLGTGILDSRIILPWAIAGAIGGYWTSWSIGRWLGHDVYRLRLFKAHRRSIARTRLFFRRWGGPSLVIGRFVLGPFQSMLPLVAGVAAMGGSRFHPWNIASSIIWILAVLSPGYLAGRGITLFGFAAPQQQVIVPALLLASAAFVVAAVALTLSRFRTSRP